MSTPIRRRAAPSPKGKHGTADLQHVYGPVPSRRLGRSLGIDLIPFKTCTYDCIYCQLGRTTDLTIERREYRPIRKVLESLGRKLDAGNPPDYISLAGSGEPTLNDGIGRLIREIKKRTRIPVAVLTNGSLLWDRKVQEELMAADLVLPSLDAGSGSLFQYVNRPHPGIPFRKMVDGIAAFSKRFPGSLWLEVFLLGGVTGLPAEVRKIAHLAKRIRPARIQVNAIGRPPAEDFALPVPADQLRSLVRLFPKPVDFIGENPRKGNRSSPGFKTGTGDVLALLKRRPCTLRDISEGLSLNELEVGKHLDVLTADGRVTRIARDGKDFYAATRAQRRRRPR